MVRELASAPKSGLLGSRTVLGPVIRNVGFVQYWDSFEALRDYARDSARLHFPTWQECYEDGSKNAVKAHVRLRRMAEAFGDSIDADPSGHHDPIGRMRGFEVNTTIFTLPDEQPYMRNYPATLVQVFENKLDEGHDTDDERIPFGKDDLTKATDELDVDVRHVMEIPSAYSSQSLPDEIADHGYTIERDTDHEGSAEQYLFVRE